MFPFSLCFFFLLIMKHKLEMMRDTLINKYPHSYKDPHSFTGVHPIIPFIFLIPSVGLPHPSPLYPSVPFCFTLDMRT